MGLDPTVKDKHSIGSIEPMPEAGKAVAVPGERLPAAIPVKKPRSLSKVFLIAGFIIAGMAAGGYWWSHRVPPLPPGIAFGNGRLEADEIDIQTKFAGRVLQLLADEGDLAKGGQVLAIMDTRDLQAQLNKAEAQVRQAQKAVEEANSNVDQLQT